MFHPCYLFLLWNVLLTCPALCLTNVIAASFLHLCTCLTCSPVHASSLHPLLAHHHLCYVDVYCVSWLSSSYDMVVSLSFYIIVWNLFFFTTCFVVIMLLFVLPRFFMPLLLKPIFLSPWHISLSLESIKIWGTWCTCCWTHSQYYEYQPNF